MRLGGGWSKSVVAELTDCALAGLGVVVSLELHLLAVAEQQSLDDKGLTGVILESDAGDDGLTDRHLHGGRGRGVDAEEDLDLRVRGSAVLDVVEELALRRSASDLIICLHTKTSFEKCNSCIRKESEPMLTSL